MATLETLLAEVAADAARAPAARAVGEMADAARALARLIGAPPQNGQLGAYAGSANSDGDGQRKLDLVAEDLFSSALRRAGVGAYLSEEVPAASLMDGAGAVAVAIDPLDGSSNIDVNAPIGTIFSILPMTAEGRNDPAAAFRQKGRAQLAAGFFIYGPQTSLVVTFGDGVHLLMLDPASGDFVRLGTMTIPDGKAEFAINASNLRHWRAPVRAFIDDCAQGAGGPLAKDFNMRWVGSLVADTFRIFTRGGVFLYPEDSRSGYEHGRLRLAYEVNPIAMLTEQAGGAATDGAEPILDRTLTSSHERSPLVLGDRPIVERIRQYHLATPTSAPA